MCWAELLNISLCQSWVFKWSNIEVDRAHALQKTGSKERTMSVHSQTNEFRFPLPLKTQTFVMCSVLCRLLCSNCYKIEKCSWIRNKMCCSCACIGALVLAQVKEVINVKEEDPADWKW